MYQNQKETDFSSGIWVGIIAVIILSILCMCTSCTPKSIVVPQYHDRTVTQHDTIRQKDVIYVHDSTVTDTIHDGKQTLRVTHYIYRDRTQNTSTIHYKEQHTADSVAADAAIRSAILQAQQSAIDAAELTNAKLQNKTLQKQISQQKKQIIEAQKEAKPITKWQHFRMAMGDILIWSLVCVILSAIVIVALKFFKK